ncbi:MAG TPA: sugar phosphate isomerase/epimerase [Thermomicrobiales bacterium]|nr:sugar phosphate isomerase/epimerase [Thermomicrobiales bacterium]
MPTLSVITDEISADLDRALTVCNELAISAVELRMIADQNVVELDGAAVAGVKRTLERHGCSVVAIASPFLKCDYWGEDEMAHQREMGVLRRSITIAHALGAPIVRAFSFWRAPDPSTLHQPALAALDEATEICRDSGVLLGFENEHACTVATGDEAAWFLDRIADDTIGMIWDPGNEAVVGSVPFPEGYERVRSRIHHVHLKDARAIAPDPTFVVMGEGAIDYIGQFRALADAGYDGALSLETHVASAPEEKEATSRASIAGIRALAEQAGLRLA